MKSIQWLAGLLEGEGCFSHRTNRGRKAPLVVLSMTDEDVVIWVARIINRRVQRVDAPSQKKRRRKVLFSVRISGYPARDLMKQLLPHMGMRRKACIKRLLKIPISYRRKPTLRA